MYEIEKGIPAPKQYEKYSSYPFEAMKVGDSFLVPKAEIQKVREAASHYAKRHNQKVKFMTRSQHDGIRVWRIA